MSYDKKIRELMERLVAMSPEPPPYPEETPMVRPDSRKTLRPTLVFAAAVALVAILAVPLLLFSGGEEPVGVASTTTSTTSPVTSTTTTVPATSTTEAATTTIEEALPVSWTGMVFLYQTPENSFLGNPALVPVEIEVVDESGVLNPEDRFTEALAAIGTDLPPDLANAIPSDVRVVDQRIEGETVVAEMSEAFLNGAGGLLADMTMLNQLVYTLTSIDPEAGVLFTVDGAPVEAFGSEGLALTEPVDRESFLDHLHLINLTTPMIEQGGRYVVAGVANVFEATLNIAVLDGEGSVVDETFVTATCGSGCWGEFSTGVDAGSIVPGESSVRVFTYSAEDGSIVDAITVPIPAPLVWQFSVGN